jgi:hypothetical protein
MRAGLARRRRSGQRPCYTRAVQAGPSTRVFVTLGVTLLLVAGAATVWHFFAAQIPSSTYHASALPGPVAQLRDASAFLGLLSLVIAPLRPWLGPQEPIRLAIATCIAWGATMGMYGLQIEDPRPISVQIFALRTIGEAILAFCFLVLALRALHQATKR